MRRPTTTQAFSLSWLCFTRLRVAVLSTFEVRVRRFGGRVFDEDDDDNDDVALGPAFSASTADALTLSFSTLRIERRIMRECH